MVLMEPSAEGSLRRAAWRGRGHAAQLLERPVATSRFLASMLLWRLYSSAVGRLAPEAVRALLVEAGFFPA